MKRSFSLFGVTLYPYSLLMIAGAGLTIGLFVYFTLTRRKGCGDENAFAVEMLLVCMAAALPAAMLLDALFKWAETGTFRFAGATFYGGLLCALALFPLLLLLKKKRTVSVWERLSDLAPAIPAGHALGRVGCFLGGCCYGCPTDTGLGVVFPPGSLPYGQYGALPLHPTQLYEAVFLLFLALFLSAWGKDRALPLYFLLYGVERFFLEFLRGDDRGSLLPGLSPAQWISLLLLLLGGALLFLRAVKKKRRHKADN